jgi:transporter family protein
MKNTLALILVTLLLWGFWGFLSKIAVSRIGLQVAFWETLACFLVAFSYLFLSQKLTFDKLDFQGVFIAILAGAFTGLASMLFYNLLGKKPVGFLVSITALYPLVTIILSVLFLKEPLTAPRVAGFVLALAALFFLSL